MALPLESNIYEFYHIKVAVKQLTTQLIVFVKQLYLGKYGRNS